MNSNICFYANKLFFCIYESLNVHLVVYSYEKHAHKSSEKFKEYSKLKLPAKSSCIKEIFLKVVSNFVTGLNCMLILIFNYEGLQDIFLYSYASRKKLVSVTLPLSFINHYVDTCHLCVTDGPTFLTVSPSRFSIYSADSQNVNYFCHSDVFGLNYRILQFNSIITSHVLYLYIIVAVTLNDPQNIYILALNSIQNSEEGKYVKLPVSIFVPEQYKTLVKAINIVKFIPSYRSNSSNLEDLICQENTSVVCTNDDCLVFFNGILKHCCRLSIPLPDIIYINTEIVSSFSKNTLIITTENGFAYLILLDGNNSEVAKYWTDVKASTTGDVTLNGSKQLIILKDTDFNTWPKNCILTDVFSYVNIEHVSEKQIPDDCLRSTVSGLQQKIQLGKSIISDTEHEISQKTAATTDVLFRLKENKTVTEVSDKCKTFRESIVDLILSKEESKIVEIPPGEESVKLIDEKQEFVDDDWILSLYFINDSNRFICFPSMKVLVRNKQVQCIQKAFIHANSSLSFLENNHYQVHPKAKFTILLKLSTSLLLNNEASFILSWYDGSASDFDSEILMKEEKCIKQHQMGFDRVIDFKDLLNKEIKKGISCLEDLLSIKLLQNKIILHISSLHSDISSLKSTLLSKNPDLLELESNCLVFRHENSLLFGVHIVFTVINEKLVSLETFFKNTSEILLFVYFLYQYLPDDVLISPSLIMTEEIFTMKEDIIRAVKSEIDLLFSSLNIHNVTEELRKNYTKLMSSQNVGTLTIPKETYQRIRKVLVKKELLTDALLRNFVEV